jgi:hypothetical protein
MLLSKGKITRDLINMVVSRRNNHLQGVNEAQRISLSQIIELGQLIPGHSRRLSALIFAFVMYG